jgi:hypothetical protein
LPRGVGVAPWGGGCPVGWGGGVAPWERGMGFGKNRPPPLEEYT